VHHSRNRPPMSHMGLKPTPPLTACTSPSTKSRHWSARSVHWSSRPDCHPMPPKARRALAARVGRCADTVAAQESTARNLETVLPLAQALRQGGNVGFRQLRTKHHAGLCRKRARSRLMHRNKTVLFDHLVGGGEQGWRHIEAQRPGGLEVDHELEFRWLHDR
jgi:hypothetical protein